MFNRQAASRPQLTNEIEAFGLQSKRVTALGLLQHRSLPSSYLYATTEDDGVYFRSLDALDSTWKSIGLEEKNLTALDIQTRHTGADIYFSPIVAVSPQREAGDTTRIYRYENQQWLAADSGIAHDSIYDIKTLVSLEADSERTFDFAFAGGYDALYRSRTFSSGWEKISNAPNVTAAIALKRKNFRGKVWAAGYTGFSLAWIGQSQDKGQTWRFSYPPLGGNNGCFALALHPEDDDVVYAGVYGGVIKTTDSGVTWNHTGLKETSILLQALELDPFMADHIYAGGVVGSFNEWTLWESFDAGETWQEIPAPAVVSATGISGIKDIVADHEASGVIYIATLGHGVWKYQSVLTEVDDSDVEGFPNEFTLEQNYPNPFNPETTISYALPYAAHVRLVILNTLGQEVARLIDGEQAAGHHRVTWKATEQASGIYFYRIKAGEFEEMKKMSLVR